MDHSDNETDYNLVESQFGTTKYFDEGITLKGCYSPFLVHSKYNTLLVNITDESVKKLKLFGRGTEFKINTTKYGNQVYIKVREPTKFRNVELKGDIDLIVTVSLFRSHEGEHSTSLNLQLARKSAEPSIKNTHKVQYSF